MLLGAQRHQREDVPARLNEVDWEEPARCEWANWPGLFAEAITDDESKILNENLGADPRPLPSPWNDPDYRPLPLHFVLEGTPGLELLAWAQPGVIIDYWVKLTKPQYAAYKRCVKPPKRRRRATAGDCPQFAALAPPGSSCLSGSALRLTPVLSLGFTCRLESARVCVKFV